MDSKLTAPIAKVEHFVVSTVTSVVPEPIRIKFRGAWEATKQWGKDTFGKKTEEKVEMVGWGVEEAQERHDEEASMCPPLVYQAYFLDMPRLTNVTRRSGDADGAGVRYSQELHFYSDTLDGSGHPEGGQDPPILGLEHRQAYSQAQVPMKDGQYPHERLIPKLVNGLASHTHHTFTFTIMHYRPANTIHVNNRGHLVQYDARHVEIDCSTTIYAIISKLIPLHFQEVTGARQIC